VSFRGRGLAVMLVASLLAPATVVATAPEAGAQSGRDVLVQLAPPGFRHLIAGARIIKAIGTRNDVYREADDVQGQFRAYYDARIQTAGRQMLNREQLGLRPSQFQAYARVKQMLEAERDVALALTEDEKRAAKYAFEGRLTRELLGALVRSPKGQRVLGEIKKTFEEVRDRFSAMEDALRGQNPVQAVIDELREKVDQVKAGAQVLKVLGADVGDRLAKGAASMERFLDQVTSVQVQSADVLSARREELEGLIGELDEQLTVEREVRGASDLLREEASDRVIKAIFPPGGEEPVEDAVADAIARGYNKNLVQNLGVAAGEIEASTLATMSERVRTELLRQRVAGIAEQCGRLSGFGFQRAAAALESGTAPESLPCSLFQNPEKLQEFIDKLKENPDDDDQETTGPSDEADWIDGSVQRLREALGLQGLESAEIEARAGVYRDCLTAAASSGQTQEEAEANCGLFREGGRAQGTIPPSDDETTVLASVITVDFCTDGRVFASFSLDLASDGESFSYTGDGSGNWDSSAGAGVVSGSYSGTDAAGDWGLEIVIGDTAVTATDTFGQTMVIPIVADAPDRC